MIRPMTAAFEAAGQPVLASVRTEAAVNRNRYDGINFSYRQRMSHRFSLNANYTLSWAYGYDSGGGTDTFFRNYSRDGYHALGPQEWGPSTTDERHHVTISGIVDLPKGFQLGPILQFGSARPFNPDTAANTLNTGGGTMLAVVVPKNDQKNYLAYTAANFSGGSRPNPDPTKDPTTWTAGDAANWAAQTCYYVTQDCVVSKYDPLRGDPFFQLDMRFSKNFRIREGMNLELIAQAFNLTNRANYGNNFGLDVGSSTFNHPIGFINPTSTYMPRSLWSEFGARFTF